MNKKILVTNDDGINAEGIIKLAETASRFGEVWVIAPDGQRSAVSHSLSCNLPVSIKSCDFPVAGVHAFACSGTPADAVRIGILKVTDEKPDYVMAGINNGYNISHDIQYSATVGAALEGAFFGIPSIAFSQGALDKTEVVDEYLMSVMEECMNMDAGQSNVWNINFPACSLKEFKGILRNRKVSFDPFYDDDYIEEKKPDGSVLYSIVQHRNWKGSEGTDLAAIIDNYISIGVVSNVR
ncbi:MAG: 5'/3'-nucleotidase SurE [Eubacterium sp.]|nr:5'/3'-nucleotidase SurE [Eubacterium sp.]